MWVPGPVYPGGGGTGLYNPLFLRQIVLELGRAGINWVDVVVF